MAHSKDSMLEDMRTKGATMMATLAKEGITLKEDQLAIPDYAEDYRMDFIRQAHYWLLDVFETQYAEVLRIKRMQPEEMWERYKKWGGFEEYREVTLLNKALSLLRAKIVSRTRPDFYKKSKRDAKANKTKAAQEKTRLSASESTEG